MGRRRDNCATWRHIMMLHMNGKLTFLPITLETFLLKFETYPGSGPILKWPLIRPNPTHTVFSQTKITGSGIWFELKIVWSEVASVWGWCDQRSLRSGDGMIRGHFGLGMVWSEVTFVWGWYDQRSLRSGDGMIRGHFGLGMVWSEVTSVWGWYDQRSLRSGDGMIRGHFGLGMVW